MQGPSHLALTWFLADASGLERGRERRIVAWAGFAPDVDVLAYLGALVWYRGDQELAFENVWRVVHHVYTHNAAFAVAVGAVAWGLATGAARSRLRVAALAMLACGLHNFLDLVGGGPTWPIYPLWPASGFEWGVPWSWTIGDWPNIVVLAACLAGTLAYARVAGRSPLECFGERADRWLVTVVRQGAVRSRGRARWVIWASVLVATVAILAPLGFNPFR